mmetsp:Transcript_78601/g.222317  ORF Transcript_78601/g.222317 Transcript_78601/m.222317 type:complete len:212 (-) Transcript_78601:167-802(-)
MSAARPRTVVKSVRQPKVYAAPGGPREVHTSAAWIVREGALAPPRAKYTGLPGAARLASAGLQPWLQPDASSRRENARGPGLCRAHCSSTAARTGRRGGRRRSQRRPVPRRRGALHAPRRALLGHAAALRAREGLGEVGPPARRRRAVLLLVLPDAGRGGAHALGRVAQDAPGAGPAGIAARPGAGAPGPGGRSVAARAVPMSSRQRRRVP